MSDLEFGVNLNNREPLIAPDYDLQMLSRPLRGGRGVRLRLRVGRRQPLLEAALRADRAAGGDLAAHVAGEARHRVHGVVDAEPALPRARVGDARPDLGRAHDLRHRDGESGGRCSARVRGARPRLRAARRGLRGGSRRPARAVDDGRGDVQGPLLRLRGRRLLPGTEMGPRPCRCSRLSGSSPTRGSRATRRQTSCSGASRRRPGASSATGTAG